MEYDITPILCVGETLEQREAGEAQGVVENQIKAAFTGISEELAKEIVVAYEPIWAIGTGKNATPEQAGEMCGVIRKAIASCYDYYISDSIRIQYGGSVKPANVSQLMEQSEIDGALVGGASLNPQDFIKIVNF